MPPGSVDDSKMKVGELLLMIALLAGEIKMGGLGVSVAGEGEGLGLGVGDGDPGTVAVTEELPVSTSRAWMGRVNRRRKTIEDVPNLIRLRTEMKFVTFTGKAGSIYD